MITERTATLSESASALSITGTIPTNTAAGDLMVVVYGMTSTTAGFTAPSGWTQIVAPLAIALNLIAVYYRFWQSGDTGPVGTASGTARQTALMQTYIGVDPATPLDVSAVTTTVTGTSIALNGVTTVTANTKVMSGVVGDWSTGTWTKPTQETLLATHTSGVGRGCAFADEDLATIGATGTRTWTDTAASLALGGFVVPLRPALVSDTVRPLDPIPFIPSGRNL